jgi:DNA/RNA-binding domain of Phe-tRNA-synthetase-like protein
MDGLNAFTIVKHISITFSEQISNKIPGIKLGLLFSGQVQVKKKPAKMNPAFHQLEIDIKEKFSTSPPSANPVVSAVRRMYRRIGWEPAQYRPSSEAMIRRLLKNKGLYP